MKSLKSGRKALACLEKLKVALEKAIKALESQAGQFQQPEHKRQSLD